MSDTGNYPDITNLVYEAGMLTRLKRSGDLLVNNRDGEHVSDHVFRAMLIGYVLAKLEGVDENKVLKTLLFHDLPEARILELNKVAARYLDNKKAEREAFTDQMKLLPGDVAAELTELNTAFMDKSTKEAVICKDADYLEAAFAAKEAIEKGIAMQNWLVNIEKALKTESAKKLFSSLTVTKSTAWWSDLKYIPDIDLGKKSF